MYTSYFGNIKNLPKDCVPISISRTCPKGMKIRMYGRLAPTAAILRDYKAGFITWDEYVERYKKEILSNLNPYIVANDLGQNAVLVCYEKPGDHCHRHLVAEWLRNSGIEISEY